MRLRRSWQQVLGLCVLAAGSLSAAGCMCGLHPIEPAAPEVVTACKAYPPCCRDHVYIFLIHGMDPLDYANLTGLRDYLQALGFRKTYYGQLYHTLQFEKEMRRIHAEDPSARFVLVGFSFGANMVCYLTNSAKEENIPIDLLVYFGGNTLKNEPHDQPENAARILNILARGAIWNGAWMDRAVNVHETDVHHFGSPTHQHSLRLLADEMATVASHVQVVEDGPAPPAAPAGEGGEWDFLKPVSRLKPAK
jgi:predicted esterase